MSLTVREKDHWRKRIADRIDKRIEQLVAEADPLYLERIKSAATEKAITSLGLDDLEDLRVESDVELKKLLKARKLILARMAAKINGTDVDEEISNVYSCHYSLSSLPSDVLVAISKRATALRSSVMLETELGQQILQLETEKEGLLDTVWLATSTAQIKSLWESVTGLLHFEPTVLEQNALDLPPMDPNKEG